MSRRINLRGIRAHRSYTVDEVTRLLGVTAHTVRRWAKDGLPILNDQRPFLILGGELTEFLRARKAPKRRCALHECYCVKCRIPQTPAEGMADYIPVSALAGRLRGICSKCDSLMHKGIAQASLVALADKLTVTRLSAYASPTEHKTTPHLLNVHLRRKDKT